MAQVTCLDPRHRSNGACAYYMRIATSSNTLDAVSVSSATMEVWTP